ncbi:MAG TPA: LpxD N-terminal domain-containing protein [Syntrophorhabdaceae bacterium]|nr:LpxD N-terminal domain-containing protein [Syntrophorhabdaceae bacterium]
MISLKDIASQISGRLVGHGDTQIRNVSSITDAKEGDITFLSHGRYAKYVKDCKASAIIVGKDFPVDSLHGIDAVVVDNPSLAYVKTLELFYPPPQEGAGDK